MRERPYVAISFLDDSTFHIDLIYHLILEHTLGRNHISEPGKRLLKCRHCDKLLLRIVIYEIILECIQEKKENR